MEAHPCASAFAAATAASSGTAAGRGTGVADFFSKAGITAAGFDRRLLRLKCRKLVNRLFTNGIVQPRLVIEAQNVFKLGTGKGFGHGLFLKLNKPAAQSQMHGN